MTAFALRFVTLLHTAAAVLLAPHLAARGSGPTLDALTVATVIVVSVALWWAVKCSPFALRCIIPGVAFAFAALVSVYRSEVPAGLGDAVASGALLLALLGAGLLGASVVWGRRFHDRLATARERTWTVWLLLPTTGTITIVLATRDALDAWTVAALGALGITAIFAHALVMGQRRQAKSIDALAPAIPVLPLATAIAVYFTVVAGSLAA